jgi:hypothetical protein
MIYDILSLFGSGEKNLSILMKSTYYKLQPFKKSQLNHLTVERLLEKAL